MKTYHIYKGLLALLLMLTFSIVDAGNFSILNIEPISNTKLGYVEYFDSTDIKKNEPIDGATAASKLRAKKSHAVSEQDETKLTVFLGIIAMAFIIFCIRIIGEGK